MRALSGRLLERLKRTYNTIQRKRRPDSWIMTSCPFCRGRLGLSDRDALRRGVLLTGAPGFAAVAAARHRAVRPSPLPLSPNRSSSTTHPPRRSSARSSGVRTWTQRRLYYYETIPSKWDWSLNKGRREVERLRWCDQAASARPAAARPRSRSPTGTLAQLRAWPPSARPPVRSCASARDTPRSTPNRRLPPYRGDGDLRPRAGSCPRFRAHHDAVLADALRAGRQRLPPALDHPGRVPQVPHHRLHPRTASFVQTYGGRAPHSRPAWCLIDPMPSALASVSFNGGVRLPGHRSLVPTRHRPRRGPRSRSACGRRDACADTPRGPSRSWSRPTELQWHDDASRANRHALLPGQARQPLRCRRELRSPRLMARWMQPPAAPVVETPAVGPGCLRPAAASIGPDPGTAYRCRIAVAESCACSTTTSLSTSATDSAEPSRRADLSFRREVFSFPDACPGPEAPRRKEQGP